MSETESPGYAERDDESTTEQTGGGVEESGGHDHEHDHDHEHHEHGHDHAHEDEQGEGATPASGP